MWRYLLRRLAYAVPIVLGVNLLTFVLFFVVNTPDDMARMQLGTKRVSAEAIASWKADKGYDLPLFWNQQRQGTEQLTATLFWTKSVSLLWLDFGRSDAGRDIAADVAQRAGPSFVRSALTLVLGLVLYVSLALLVVMFRYSLVDRSVALLAVVLISTSDLFFVMLLQFVVAKLWHWAPVSGYQAGWESWRFLALPVVVGVVSGLGAGLRWYRTLFIEQAESDYLRSAKSRGLSDWQVIYRHLLPNASMPIVTGVVAHIPLLFMGSLIVESFFGIPGLGSYVLDALNAQDFAIVRTMVFFGAVLYLLGLWLTDVVYAWLDPRVRFE